VSGHRQKFDAAIRRAEAAALRAFNGPSNDLETAALALWQRGRHDKALQEDVYKAGCVLLIRDALARSLIPLPPGSGPKSFKVESDPALADFVDQRLGREPLLQIAAACRREFGPARAPSKSAIHRYWHRRAATQPKAPAT